MSFQSLGLRKLVATSYRRSAIVGTQLPLFDIEGLKPQGREPYAIEINAIPDANGDGAVDLADVEYLLRHEANTTRPLEGDSSYAGGDFRSAEATRLLAEADIVVTNPPFSLFREFVAQLMAHDKQFLIIGNMNAITYKEIFAFISANRLWLGIDNGGTKWFRVPEDYDIKTESRKKRKMTSNISAWGASCGSPTWIIPSAMNPSRFIKNTRRRPIRIMTIMTP